MVSMTMVSLQGVLERRFLRGWKKTAHSSAMERVDKNDPWALPDLVVIDGGKGQLSAAVKGMEKAKIYPKLVSSVVTTAQQGLVDGEDEEDTFLIEEETYPPPPPPSSTENEYQTTVNVVAIAKNKEELFVSSNSDPVNKSSDSPTILLLRALRDESHRFAGYSHRRRRSHMNGL